MSSDKLWLNDISILISKERFIEFFPTKDMTLNEQLNSIVRLCLYISIVLMIVKNNYIYIYVFIGSLLITALVYLLNKNKEQFNQKPIYINDPKDVNLLDKISRDVDCKKPTDNNPFMNVLLTDDYTDTKKSCIYTEETKKDIDKKFYSDLFNDVSNLYGRRFSQRSFYSMPSTTVPNDQASFAHWCYRVPETCKEGNMKQCVNNLYTPLPNTARGGNANFN